MNRNEPSAKCLWCHLAPNTILAVWAALKITIDLGLTAFMLYCLFIMNIMHPFKWDGYSVAATVFAVMSVTDIVFMAMLSSGIDQKNVRKIKIVYYYCFYLLGLGTFLIIGFFVLVILYHDHLGINSGDLVIVFFIFLNFGLVIRIILLLRSEIARMQGVDRLANSPPPDQKETRARKPFQNDEENDSV